MWKKILGVAALVTAFLFTPYGRETVSYAQSQGWVIINGALQHSGNVTIQNGTLGFSPNTSSAADTFIVRDAANILSIRNGVNEQVLKIGPSSNYSNISSLGGTLILSANAGAANWGVGGTGQFIAISDNTADIGVTGAFRPRSIFLGGPSITVGAGTGITVNSTGEVREEIYKVTVLNTAFICAAVTCDVTLGTLPAKTFVRHVLADQTVVFACSATCTTSTLSYTVGKTAGGNQYLVSVDADAATGQFGDAAAELGASLTPATVPTLDGDLAAWSATTPVVLRMTSGTGNIGTGAATNFSTGSVTVYITTIKMQ